MKKLFILLLISTFLIGSVIAVNQGAIYGVGPHNQNGTFASATGKGGGQKVSVNGEYSVGEGRKVHVQRTLGNKTRLRIGNFSADCDCELTQEQVQNRTKFYARLSNGRNAEVKIMPDKASLTALQRLRLKNCSEDRNCSIALKEVGTGQTAKLAYELQTKRNARFLGIFKTQMNVKAQVDAETGEILQIKKPWWAFMALEPEE